MMLGPNTNSSTSNLNLSAGTEQPIDFSLKNIKSEKVQNDDNNNNTTNKSEGEDDINNAVENNKSVEIPASTNSTITNMLPSNDIFKSLLEQQTKTLNDSANVDKTVNNNDNTAVNPLANLAAASSLLGNNPAASLLSSGVSLPALLTGANNSAAFQQALLAASLSGFIPMGNPQAALVALLQQQQAALAAAALTSVASSSQNQQSTTLSNSRKRSHSVVSNTAAVSKFNDCVETAEQQYVAVNSTSSSIVTSKTHTNRAEIASKQNGITPSSKGMSLTKPKSQSKPVRPFKAYPKDPLSIPLGFLDTEGFTSRPNIRNQLSSNAVASRMAETNANDGIFPNTSKSPTSSTKSKRSISGGSSSLGSGITNPRDPIQAAALQAMMDASAAMVSNGAMPPGGLPSGQTPSQIAAAAVMSATTSHVPTRRRPRALPDDQKDEHYWERRRKNNEAAKRSRDSRRAKEDEIALRASFLEQENLKLRYEIATLKQESEKLREQLRMNNIDYEDSEKTKPEKTPTKINSSLRMSPSNLLTAATPVSSSDENIDPYLRSNDEFSTASKFDIAKAMLIAAGTNTSTDTYSAISENNVVLPRSPMVEDGDIHQDLIATGEDAASMSQ